MLRCENKKGMGVSTSAHPCSQAFALPHVKDKQRSQPTPSDYMAGNTLFNIYGITRIQSTHADA
jgi:hypothetical protein